MLWTQLEEGCYRRTKGLQRSWVSKGRSNVVGDTILGREVDLLEELRGNGDASSSSDPSQGTFTVMMIMMKIIFAVTVH